jgi:drug/metabolite transporter (DMT)-like permease
MATQTQLPDDRAPALGQARPILIATALGIVYVVWGSTYLAIRIMVEEMPPLLAAGTRFLTAGLLVAGALTARGGLRRLAVTRAQLVGCALIGLLLPALGQGMVTIGEHGGAPSGITALLIAAVPLWVICCRVVSGDRPTGRTLVGGSVLAFSAYIWLLQSTSVSLVATYAYVNPLVAVVLGWLVVAEPLTMPTIVGGAVVVLGVAVVVGSELPSRADRTRSQRHRSPGTISPDS